MKMRVVAVLTVAWCALTLIGRQEAARAEGSLTPPAGAFGTNGPAAFMKTLDQVEPRCLISSLPYAITNSGAYYLVDNLMGATNSHGITIDADNVQLDLSGFTLIGSTNPAGSDNFTLTGIYIDDDPIHKNIVIRNGVVHNWGHSGIKSVLARDCEIDGISVTYNGGTNGYDGFEVGQDWLITDCLTAGNGRDGISSTGRCTVRRTIARANLRHGINLSSGARVLDCVAIWNAQDGIRVYTDSFVKDCVADMNTSNGINVADGCVVENSHCANNGNTGVGAGILAAGECRIDGNHLRKNQYGIQIPVGNSKSFVIRNSAVNNTIADYDMSPLTHYGLILTNILLRANFTSMNPWGNFSL